MKRDWGLLQQHAKSVGRDPRKLTFGHCNFIHLVDTPSHARAVAASKAPFIKTMGTHRTYEGPAGVRTVIGSIDHINARIDIDLVKAGLKYLVLEPVTDDPAQIDLLAKKVMTHFK